MGSVCQKAHVVGGGLHPQYAGELVVDLHAGRTHVMLDAATFDTRGQPRADLLRQRGCDLLAQEGRHPRHVCGQHRLARDCVVQRHQNLVAAKPQPLLLFGTPNELTLALMMGAGWLVNPGVAEWLIRKERVAATRAVATRALPTTS